ncbi:hypothetical protein COV05_02775 [Candidatus Uhrbacteria bacterium CG10_big_fil_rev_8_21_14_0_10_48_16]|uniref:Uncharacterized protein n=1 Tax=Candidatus Uhrbacteria bacterium CG10_big_fil_rev_8_21_14_0_10_48_16 TaxID=1975038 RepID=A0A2M8LH48_9BACT|nr:MAG: hypothetical protein COV05_02775 [Candidatus Uhrbacteria bacterium CG10_big_fil_rev_8_21_14_0_10_48_16]
MPRRKSILIRAEIDIALKSHNCQHNKAHRISQGDKRLKIKSGRSWEHFCVACAKDILRDGVQRVEELIAQLEE